MPSGSRAFPSAPEAAAAAREFLRELTAGRLPRAILGDALLLTTELVTNAVRHADPHPNAAVEVVLTMDEDRVVVAVRDAGSGFDPGVPHVRTEEGGWGLDLVETVATRWGVERRPGANEVWFEIDRRPS